MEQLTDLSRPVRASLMVLAIAMAVCIFLTEPYTQQGFAHATLYLAPLLLIYKLNNLWLLILATLLCVILGGIGYFISPNGFDREMASANRIASIFALGSYLFLFRKQSSGTA